MADRKISDLTALTAPASGDYLPIVDISEAAAASKNKRITIQSLFQGIPVNVGIGTSSPATLLHATGAALIRGGNQSSSNNAPLPSETSPLSVLAYTGYLASPSTSINIGAANFDAVNNSNPFQYSITTPGVGGLISFAVNSVEYNGSTYTTKERLRIDSSGNVGIGTTSPATPLHVYQNTTGGVSFRVENSEGYFELFTNNDNCGYSATQHIFYNKSLSERARIDSSGRLLVGTSSARTGSASIIPSLQCEGTAGSGSSSLFCRNSDSASGPTLQFAKTRGTSNGSSTVVQSGDELGLILFSGADGTDIDSRGAQIGAYVDGTPGLDDMPGRLVFSTTADGSATPTERMRIDSLGRVGVGTSSPTTLLDVNADTVRVRTARTPASATATGATGEICWDASYIYVCTATNTWKRAALSTW